jgi:hypothetical protein
VVWQGSAGNRCPYADQAENISRRQRWIGWLLLLLSTTLVVVSLLKGFYSPATNTGDPLSALFLTPFAKLIGFLYWTIPGIPTLWSIAPFLNLGHWLDQSNAKFLFVFGLMFVGG